MANIPYITQIHVKNFRCFTQYSCTVDNPILIIEGINGVGKTSLLEALYYTCYLRSFRTHSPKELIRFGQHEFFIKTEITEPETLISHAIQVGFSHNKRVVKVDKKSISSFKELMYFYKVISLTEDDLDLIKGAPQIRRSFMDQVLLLTNPDFAEQLRTHRQIVDQRNALLQHHAINKETYHILSEQLWESTQKIQSERQHTMGTIQEQLGPLLCELGIEGKLIFTYRSPRTLQDSFAEFVDYYADLLEQERRFKRSLFGAHLDDLSILFNGKRSKEFASRGQQKLIVLLIKMAQARQMVMAGGPLILLLDDFMTDFDHIRSGQLVDLLLQLNSQIIFTTPLEGGELSQQLALHGAQKVTLTV